MTERCGSAVARRSPLRALVGRIIACLACLDLARAPVGPNSQQQEALGDQAAHFVWSGCLPLSLL